MEKDSEKDKSKAVEKNSTSTEKEKKEKEKEKSEPEKDETKETEKTENETNESDTYKKFLIEIEKMSSKKSTDKAMQEIERLTSNKYLNPFDILELSSEADETEIKRKFKSVIYIYI